MQSILITGCSSGIGEHVAKRLHQQGYDVLATARQSQDVEKLKQAGLKAYQLDLQNEQSVEQGFIWAVENAQNKQIDVLFNNGAYGQAGALEDISRYWLEQQFACNVFGWHQLSNLCIKHMRQFGSGKIIHNSSVLGIVSMPFRGAYNASKYAIEGLADTQRLELANTNIHVSLIEPGPILSQFRANAMAQIEKSVDIENSVYTQQYQGILNRLKKEGPAAPFTLPPEAVYKRVERILKSNKPKPRYYVTFPTYLFGFLKRILPATWLDKIIGSVKD
ncbi:short-chain dehydrogenase [Saccharobesus litoralis]|uniref:Short-chain dehydrogenase n=1 Tax=Saccharobesus litoralis TaxID=2172099 RepID=A0A2S0VVC8_9ALTE|nr:SDR family NAD(P)-dependent oxidoreductase [Saccharobesus litoralis]AWB68133.1 short-chain dehydrogenase [Saccharobesus litoralis]